MELDSTEINKIQFALVYYIAKMKEDKTISKELINSYIELLERIELN